MIYCDEKKGIFIDVGLVTAVKWLKSDKKMFLWFMEETMGRDNDCVATYIGDEFGDVFKKLALYAGMFHARDDLVLNSFYIKTATRTDSQTVRLRYLSNKGFEKLVVTNPHFFKELHILKQGQRLARENRWPYREQNPLPTPKPEECRR